MANGSHGPVALVRKILAGTLGAIAAFVLLFGIGLGRWAIIALGAALLVIAIALVAFPALRVGGRSWVAGSAHVVSASEAPPNSTFGRCELQIVIEAPGLPPSAIKVRDPRVPVAKWPYPGATLPITVAVDDPRHVRIQWDDVLTHAEAAAQEQLGGYDDTQTDLPPYRADDGASAAGDSRRGDTRDLADDVDTVLADERAAERAGAGSVREGERVLEVPGRERIVVRDTPAGTILEGTIVEGPPADHLPRRARVAPPEPRSAEPGSAEPGSAEPGSAEPGSAEPDAAGSEAGERPAGPPPPGGAASGPASVPHQQRRKPRPYPRRDSDGPRGAATAAATAATAAARAAAATATEPAGPADDLDDLITAYPSARPSPTGAIHGVGITVLVTDLERSVAFYRDMLGFFEIDGGDGNAVLASGDTRLVLREIPDVTKVNRRVVHINLEVGDVQATYEDLKAKGVRFTYGPRPVSKGERLELWAAAFRDPDGHGIAITQWRSRPN